VRDCSWVPRAFENANDSNFACTSDRTLGLTAKYNCIAWAAGKTDNWWWPEATGGYYWPPGLPKEQCGQETLVNFVDAFGTEGYLPCRDGAFERGFEKIAIYADSDGCPLHAARLLPNGVWTSKLGDMEDIEHESLTAVEGSLYGSVVSFLKRPTSNQPIMGAGTPG
jgi:hypothetical protein